MNNTFYVTTPIYYATAAPHLGSLYSTLLADVAARYHKLAGQDVFFLTGTDEHGQKIVEAAAKDGKDPKSFIDGFIDAYKSVWSQYNIAYDYFIRTTDDNHKKAVQNWLQKLIDQGDIYKGAYIGWYCVPCESFVTEKDSKEEVAEGQAPICPDCARATKQVSEECYFFKLSAYQDKLLDFYEKNPDFIAPKERLAEIVSFVKGGLKDLSISRTTIDWGIPFPGDEQHVTYVWADALNNYITAIGYGDENRQGELQKWWPANLQILGKDIVRFHAIYWPAFLMASNLPMPHKLLVHGWIKVADQKMSKSKGNAVDPVKLAETYGVDEIRYYLTRKMAVTQDSEFRFEDIEQSNNSELANAFGNLLNRMATLTLKNDCSLIEAPQAWSEHSQILQKQAHDMVQETWSLVQAGMSYRAVSRVWDFINQVNAYFHEQQPWKVVKIDRGAFVEVMSAVAHSLKTIGIMLWPVMPTKMEKLLQSIGVTLDTSCNYIALLQEGVWNENFAVQKIDNLFTKIEIVKEPMEEQKQQQEEKKKEEFLKFEDFLKVDMRVGTVTACDAVEDSKKLLKLQVDFGELGQRQILSGIKEFYQPEDLVGKQGLFVVNLKPRKMAGLMSEGMMLFALDEENGLKVMSPLGQVPAGIKVG